MKPCLNGFSKLPETFTEFDDPKWKVISNRMIGSKGMAM